MAAVFTAQYAGPCAACDTRIRPGNQVTWVRDELVHVTCPQPAAPCPRCFTVPAANGACACEDEPRDAPGRCGDATCDEEHP